MWVWGTAGVCALRTGRLRDGVWFGRYGAPDAQCGSGLGWMLVMVVGEYKVRVLGMYKEKVWVVEKWIGR